MLFRHHIKHDKKTSIPAKTPQTSTRQMATKVQWNYATYKNQTVRIYSALGTPLEFAALTHLQNMLHDIDVPSHLSKSGGLMITNQPSVNERLQDIMDAHQFIEKTTVHAETWHDNQGNTQLHMTATNVAPLQKVSETLEKQGLTPLLFFSHDTNPWLRASSTDTALTEKVAEILKEHELEVTQHLLTQRK